MHAKLNKKKAVSLSRKSNNFLFFVLFLCGIESSMSTTFEEILPFPSYQMTFSQRRISEISCASILSLEKINFKVRNEANIALKN